MENKVKVMNVLTFLCGEETSYKVTEISFLQKERERVEAEHPLTGQVLGLRTGKKGLIIIFKDFFPTNFTTNFLLSIIPLSLISCRLYKDRHTYPISV